MTRLEFPDVYKTIKYTNLSSFHCINPMLFQIKYGLGANKAVSKKSLILSYVRKS